MKYFLLLLCLVFSSHVIGTGRNIIKPYKTIRLPVNEPSEICLASDQKSFYVLADKASLYRFDSLGKITAESPDKSFDIEGAVVYQNKIYVVDESLRLLLEYDEASLKLLNTLQLQFNGARNTAFESITFNQESQHFYIATEKNPQIFIEYDKQFININQFSIPGINEVSGMTWHNNQLWVLSDEQETVYQIDPATHQILHSWQLPIINPEGLCFDNEGNLVIVSDDMGKMFFFKNPLL